MKFMFSQLFYFDSDGCL